MSAVADTPAVESVDLAEAAALISGEPDVVEPESPSPASPEASQGSAPAELLSEIEEEGAAFEAGEASEEGPPDFWAEDDKPAWSKVPAELRPVLRKYERQRLDRVAEATRRSGEERDQAVRVAEEAYAAVAQAADWWRQNGPAFHQAFVDRWSKVDWKALAEKDPAEVGRLIEQRQAEEALLADAARRGAADMAAAQAAAEQAFAEARRVEQGKLAARLPEWFGTPQVAQRTWDDLRRYLFGKGVAADRIAAVHEAPIVEIALAAMRFENAQALARRSRERAAAGRTPSGGARAAAPARVSPGPANRPVEPAPDDVQIAAERFRQGGGDSIEAAAELIRLSGL